MPTLQAGYFQFPSDAHIYHLMTVPSVSPEERSNQLNELTTQTLPAVPHVIFGIFNLAIPNIIFWVIVIVVFAVSAWLRLPGFIEHSSKDKEKDPK